MLCTCEDAIIEHSQLYNNLISEMYYQVSSYKICIIQEIINFFFADKRSSEWFFRRYRFKQQFSSHNSQPTFWICAKQFKNWCCIEISCGQIWSSFKPKIQLDFWWRRRWRRQACRRGNNIKRGEIFINIQSGEKILKFFFICKWNKLDKFGSLIYFFRHNFHCVSVNYCYYHYEAIHQQYPSLLPNLRQAFDSDSAQNH